jgi:hypothetical protein
MRPITDSPRLMILLSDSNLASKSYHRSVVDKPEQARIKIDICVKTSYLQTSSMLILLSLACRSAALSMRVAVNTGGAGGRMLRVGSKIGKSTLRHCFVTTRRTVSEFLTGFDVVWTKRHQSRLTNRSDHDEVNPIPPQRL